MLNKILLYILLVNTPIVLNAQQNSRDVEAQFKSLSWLKGNWDRTNPVPGSTASEKWEQSSSYELKGLGITLKGADTVFIEKIKLQIRDNDIFYVADVPENKAAIYFKLIATTPRGFICINPQHDFPKRIEYLLNGRKLTVVISGDGKSQEYLFEKR
jgi:hypothetical protein